MASQLEALRNALTNQLVSDKYVQDSTFVPTLTQIVRFNTRYLRAKIEQYLNIHIAHGSVMRSARKESSVDFRESNIPAHENELIDIRRSVDVLFYFYNKQFNTDLFLTSIKSWIHLMLSSLLTVASYEDHRFIMLHIARSRQGAGRDFSPFIQLPSHNATPLATDHILATLYFFLHMKDGSVSIECLAPSPSDAALDWCAIDRPDAPAVDIGLLRHFLDDNDLSAIFSQFNLAPILTDSLANIVPDVNHALRIFAFLTQIIRVLADSFNDESKMRFATFIKSVSKQIYDVSC